MAGEGEKPEEFDSVWDDTPRANHLTPHAAERFREPSPSPALSEPHPRPPPRGLTSRNTPLSPHLPHDNSNSDQLVPCGGELLPYSRDGGSQGAAQQNSFADSNPVRPRFGGNRKFPVSARAAPLSARLGLPNAQRQRLRGRDQPEGYLEWRVRKDRERREQRAQKREYEAALQTRMERMKDRLQWEADARSLNPNGSPQKKFSGHALFLPADGQGGWAPTTHSEVQSVLTHRKTDPTPPSQDGGKCSTGQSRAQRRSNRLMQALADVSSPRAKRSRSRKKGENHHPPEAREAAAAPAAPNASPRLTFKAKGGETYIPYPYRPSAARNIGNVVSPRFTPFTVSAQPAPIPREPPPRQQPRAPLVHHARVERGTRRQSHSDQLPEEEEEVSYHNLKLGYDVGAEPPVLQDDPTLDAGVVAGKDDVFTELLDWPDT